MEMISIANVASEAKDGIQKTLNRLERMHERRGLVFQYSWSQPRVVEKVVGSTWLRSRKIQPLTVEGTGAKRTITHTVHDLTVLMSPLSQEWQLLYTVSPADPTEGDGSLSIVSVNPTITNNAGLMHTVETTMPTTFKDTCDHCNSGKRGRHKTMVFQHIDDKDIVNIGSSCVLEYTGVDPALIESIIEFKAMATTNQTGGRFGSWVSTMSTEEFALRTASWMLGHSKYQRGLGNEIMTMGLGINTADGVLSWGYREWQTNKFIPVFPAHGVASHTDNETEFTDECMELASRFHEYCINLSGNSSFEHSVRNIYKAGVVTAKTCNMAGGIVASFIKTERKQAVEKVKETSKGAPSVHMGTVGDKITVNGAVVTFIRTIDGYYGTTTLTKMSDGNGAHLVWFRSGNKSDLQVGNTVDITGTVKKHDKYGDENQTVITRCKFELKE